MGITIVQKSNLSVPKPNAKVALVLAGGAISGGAFKLGGLEALDQFLINRKTTEMDIYLGLSAGAFLAAPLSAGISPRELLASLTGDSTKIDQFGPFDFYLPNWREFTAKPAYLVRDLALFLPEAGAIATRYVSLHRTEMNRLFRTFLHNRSYSSLERLMAPIAEEIATKADLKTLTSYLPGGLFDNSGIERFIRKNLAKNGIPNDFSLLYNEVGRRLYIGATRLNTAQGVVFGHDEDCSVTISQAVQASSAIPGFFRPARINGIDYVDAGVRKTANISVAVRKGADLVIAYNPFRPFVQQDDIQKADLERSIGDLGFPAIMNQTFRMMLHSRLRLGIEKLRLDRQFHGDVLLIEPPESDIDFFNMNPIAFWHRKEAAEHGHRSVRKSLEANYPMLVKIFRAYNIEVDPKGFHGISAAK